MKKTLGSALRNSLLFVTIFLNTACAEASMTAERLATPPSQMKTVRAAVDGGKNDCAPPSESARNALVHDAFDRAYAYLAKEGHSVRIKTAPKISSEGQFMYIHFDVMSISDQLFKASFLYSCSNNSWEFKTMGILTGEH